jgi:4-diphosphocytidyl-2-C-methyl-D-erythritol kinase
MIFFPPCKINLGLHILSRRDDGYHEIETGMLEVPFRDILEIVPSDSFAFTSSGLEIPGTENSCIAAYELLKAEHGIGAVRIHLHKIVPMGGGLGGGSSDSAYTLLALDRLFDLGLSVEQLEAYAARLGSDNPFFIRGGLQLARGRGELLQPLEIALPKWHVCLVNLGIHVPTKDAYRHVTPNNDRPPLEEILRLPVAEWKTQLINDFEESVFAQYPQLAVVKEELYAAGAVYAAMSGSGSTLFGLFAEQPDAVAWSQKPEFEKWIG